DEDGGQKTENRGQMTQPIDAERPSECRVTALRRGTRLARGASHACAFAPRKLASASQSGSMAAAA
ncbi:MAG: hypothetical protein KJ626_12135, partial [Verrucomicrobia bacterium]|nr:hypothetical protein [Verrucomicrobiota bacterium]